MKPKLYTSEAWLRLHYFTMKQTMAEMAKICGVSEMTIRTALKSKGLIK
jgi:hypothetical protein